MATLCLDPELEHGPWRDLHDWLGGNWAVLLSNPEDFQPLERKKGPWLAAMRQDFAVRALRALAVKRDAEAPRPAQSTQSSWIDDLRGNPQTVWLREPPFAAADPVSFAARALRGELLTARSRFVMVIDGSLKRRSMLKYSAGGSAPAAADVLAAVDALRSHRGIVGRQVIGKAA
jgi:alkyl hydroperoxide reductase subunit AhpC